MSIKLQLALLLASLLTTVFVTFCVVRFKMNVKYGIVWILWALIILFLSIFPFILIGFSDLLGVQTASNTVFLITIFLAYALSFYLFMKISKQNDEIKNLTYEVAKLSKEIKEKNRNE
ncbi:MULTISPECIES: DUF2304 domain-containing protein [Anaerorhabdus]|uniref:DUF2304 domain-containing protein n=1 Tax=Anaerorhabdus furcosa TaxID=118967 RepID=A0A1T4LU15_9FIRM|nr:DUF2304 domain-containing protein [Anaerorhabdus furcosa]SJZ58192.1 hypothetical protein SAMN02745191_1046 [Anaerorhabdus furcosa]